MEEENHVQQVTTRENQVQQVTARENQVQQVTTKDPKKVEVGKRLAKYNRKKREELKAQNLDSSQYYSIGGCSSCGGDRQPWLLYLPRQERRSQCRQ